MPAGDPKSERRSPPVTFGVDDLRTPEQLEMVLRQFEEALRAPVTTEGPSLAALADDLTPTIREQIQNTLSITDFSGSPAFIVDTHYKKSMTPAGAYQQGAAFYETDRDVAFVNEISGAVHSWRYFAGEYRATVDFVPTDLGTPDAGFQFYDSELGITHRWVPTDWIGYLLGMGAYSDSLYGIFSSVRGGGSIDSPTAVISGMNLGQFDWKGQLTTVPSDLGVAARIVATAAQNFTQGGSGTIDWSLIGGAGTGWNTGPDYCWDMAVIGDDLYVALGGNTSGDSSVWRLRSGSWTQIGGGGLNGSWTAAGSASRNTAITLAVLNDKLYVGIGQNTSFGTQAQVWELTPDTTWVQIGGPSLGWSTTNGLAAQLLVIGSTLYLGLTERAGATATTLLMTWDGTAGDWTEIADPATFSESEGEATAIAALAVTGSTLYIGTFTQDGGISAGRVYKHTLGSGVFTRVAGNGVNSSWSGSASDICAAIAIDPITDDVFAMRTRATDMTTVWKSSDGGTTWAQIGGDGVNGSWNTDPSSGDTIWHDGSLVVDGSYLYAGVPAEGNPSDESGVWRWALDGLSDWEQIAGDASNNSWDNSNAESMGNMRVIDGVLYAGIGTNQANADAELWSTQVGTANSPGNLDVETTPAGAIDSVKRTRFYYTGAIGFGGTDFDGLYYDPDNRRWGILTGQTPARSFHVAGDDGWRLKPTGQPSSPIRGDQIINSNRGNWFEWYDSTAWRPAVSGPDSAVDGDIAVADGVSGRIIRFDDASTVVKEAGAWIPITGKLNGEPVLIFGSDFGLLMGWDPTFQ